MKIKQETLQVVERAAIQSGDVVLEPSVGDGQIAEQVLRLHGSKIQALEGCEIDENRWEQCGLRLTAVSNELREEPTSPWPKITIAHCDFLAPGHFTFSPPNVVVMNPPFAKGQDIFHVMLAFDLLKPGGRLVAIMSAGVTFRQEKKYVKFRGLVEDFGSMEALPNKTFHSSGTDVSAVLVQLRKPA